MDRIVECVKGLVATELDDDREPSQIDAETPLFEGGLELDSFAVVRIISLLEAQFGFEFDEEDLCAENFGSIKALGRLVAAKLAAHTR